VSRARDAHQHGRDSCLPASARRPGPDDPPNLSADDLAGTHRARACAALVRGAQQMVKVDLSPIALSCGFTVSLASGLHADHGMSQARGLHRENS
jgi:hypothetical protein